MSEHRAAIEWRRTTESFAYRDYDRSHTWRFPGGVEVAASAAPAFLGRAERVNPEEAFVASLASCHMLSFLFACSKRGYVLDDYRDEAVGLLQRGPDGKMWIAEVVLRPRTHFAPGKAPDAVELRALHEEAHAACFIASSVKTAVRIEPAAGERTT